MKKKGMRFNGPDYVPVLDNARLSTQYVTIFNLMKDGEWRSLGEVDKITGHPEASISAQLRHMRKKRFGSHLVLKRRVGDPRDGLFEYRLIVNENGAQGLIPPEIDVFKGKYAFLSNFFIEPDNTHVEAEYQQAKCISPVDSLRLITPSGWYMPPAKAKRFGKTVRLRPDWESVKLQIMEDLVMAKFADHEDLRSKLLATGDAQLIEGNHWHDFFWGVCNCGKCPEGQNHLGKILMKVREWCR